MRLIALAFVLAYATAASGAKPAQKKPTTSKASKKKNVPPAPKKPPAYPCAALPWRPILLTSRVARSGDTAVVTQDLLVEGKTPTAKGDDPRLFVSFGAPGLPRSMRVEFAGLHDGELAFPSLAEGRTRALVYGVLPESDGACTVLGRPREAGVVIELPRDLAVDPVTRLAVLRVEQTLTLGQLPDGGHDLVLRLGTDDGRPVRVGPVQGKDRPALELCAHGLTSVPIVGSPLFQATLPSQNLCVTYK